MTKNESATVYVCPMHKDVTSSVPGKCHLCGEMELVESTAIPPAQTSSHRQNTADSGDNLLSKLRTFKPLIIIISMLVLASFVQTIVFGRLHPEQPDIGHTHQSEAYYSSALHVFMASFMGGFFIVFGSFKLIDLRGFVTGFKTYDLAAAELKWYGYIYPFIELALGFAYLLHFEVTVVNWATLLLSTFGAVGIWKKLRAHEVIRCACLGTLFNLPLTNITLIENLTMAIMALGMLTLSVS